MVRIPPGRVLDAVYEPSNRSSRNQVRRTVGSFPSHNEAELTDASYAHDALTRFMREHGFEVDEHFHLPTAWRATFSHGQGGRGGRTLGVNSEMDALPGIGMIRNYLIVYER